MRVLEGMKLDSELEHIMSEPTTDLNYMYTRSGCRILKLAPTSDISIHTIEEDSSGEESETSCDRLRQFELTNTSAEMATEENSSQYRVGNRIPNLDNRNIRSLSRDKTLELVDRTQNNVSNQEHTYNVQDRHRVDRQRDNLRESLNNSQTVNNIQQLRLPRRGWLQNPFSELRICRILHSLETEQQIMQENVWQEVNSAPRGKNPK